MVDWIWSEVILYEKMVALFGILWTEKVEGSSRSSDYQMQGFATLLFLS